MPLKRVHTLHYRLRKVETISYEGAVPLAFETDVGTFSLADGRLAVILSRDFDTFASAHAAVGEVLNNWERAAELRFGPGEFVFEADGGVMEDRTPPTPGTNAARADILLASASMHATATTSTITRRSAYPAPPTYFRDSAEVRELVTRWNQQRIQREPPLGAAYYILTRIVELGGGTRKLAAARYNTDVGVLGKVGELTSKRGDELSARKAEATTVALSASESAWLNAAVPALIARVADTRDLTSLPKLTMRDLPPL